MTSNLIVVAIATLVGCSDGGLCDPDQKYSHGICYPPDAALETADANARFAHFADVCMDDTACDLPTAYCLKQPGAAAGYCTGIGCLEDPTICPPDWSCVDLSIYSPGLPSVCAAP